MIQEQELLLVALRGAGVLMIFALLCWLIRKVQRGRIKSSTCIDSRLRLNAIVSIGREQRVAEIQWHGTQWLLAVSAAGVEVIDYECIEDKMQAAKERAAEEQGARAQEECVGTGLRLRSDFLPKKGGSYDA